MINIEHIEFSKQNMYERTYESLQEAFINCQDDDLKAKIQENLDLCFDYCTKFSQAENKYIEQFSKLLGKYYKVDFLRETKYGTYTERKYWFIYQVIDVNSTIWVLEVKPDDNYNGGVKDYSVRPEDIWMYDITLEEISSDDFNTYAQESTAHVITRRIEREKEKKNESNN